jgi:hypothetical protein
MPKHKSEPVLAKPAPEAEAPADRFAPEAIPAGELAEIEYFQRSRDTAAEGFKRVRGTRPTGHG